MDPEWDYPSILDKSPQEHIYDARESPQPLAESPIPGHFRVKFYTEYIKICTNKEADLEYDFPLDPDGSLNIALVKYAWGLENCWFIEPARFTAFGTKDPNRLSPIAIQVLSEGQGCLKFIEHSASPSTIRKRQLRRITLKVVSFFVFLHRTITTWVTWLLVCSRIWYNTICHKWELSVHYSQDVYKSTTLLIQSTSTLVPKLACGDFGQFQWSPQHTPPPRHSSQPWQMNYYLLMVVLFLLISTALGA